MKTFTFFALVTLFAAATICAAFFFQVHASETGKTIPAFPPRALKEKTSLKLEKVYNVVGGWIEFRQMATDGKYIYACSSAGTFSKFEIETGKHLKTSNVPGGVEHTMACTYSNGFAYAIGRRKENKKLPSVIWRFNSTTMEIAGEPLEIPGDKIRSWQMIADDDYLYLPTLTEPGRVLRVRLNPFEHDLTITFASNENYASAISFDDSREHIYVATHNPALIKKISAQTLEEIDTAVLNYTQDNGYVRMDQDGQFIYCAVSNGYASVVKVDMDLMEVVAVSQAGNREMGNGVVVSDRGAGILHVGNLELGFSWSKVDATAGEDGEDMENMGTELKLKEEPANRMKTAMIIRDKVWVANGRGKLLRFGPVVDGGKPAYTFNNKYSGEPTHIVLETDEKKNEEEEEGEQQEESNEDKEEEEEEEGEEEEDEEQENKKKKQTKKAAKKVDQATPVKEKEETKSADL
jgi:hypothetical protein